jgi:hypothetical protein
MDTLKIDGDLLDELQEFIDMKRADQLKGEPPKPEEKAPPAGQDEDALDGGADDAEEGDDKGPAATVLELMTAKKPIKK